MANGLISKMWTDDPNQLQTKYRSPAGIEYQDFRDNHVHAAFGAAMTAPPIVLVDDALLPSAPSNRSHVVRVSVFWQLPGDPVVHNYTTTGVVAKN